MDLRHLRSFVAIAEAESFSRAATRLHVTQPALSRQIRDLEAELGVRLFDRSRRRVRLTAVGDDMLRRSRDALVEIDALRERARSLGGGRVGILRVGASPQVLESVLSEFLTRHRRAHPDIEVQLVEQGAVMILRLVEDGHVQIGIGVHPVREPLRARVLFPARIVAVMPTSSPLGRKRTVTLGELASQRLLVLRPSFATRQILDGAFQAVRIHPHLALESGDPHCLLKLAEAGHGVAIVPSTLLLPREGVRLAPIVDDNASLGFWVVVGWDSRRFLPPYGERFIAELVDHTRHSYPGNQFDRKAPAIRPIDEAALRTDGRPPYSSGPTTIRGTRGSSPPRATP
jgi:DNA-binding transcriptional LysR family regulator